MSRLRVERRLAGALLACALGVGAGACAKDSTSVLTTIEADAAAPPILLLQARVARADDPTRATSGRFTSSNIGDAADRPGPFVFPFTMSLTVDASFAGAVVITIDGLDWDSNAVIASGTTTADVVAQHDTQATVRLLRP
jgi:hypothetical protein